ncbi:hypothetical protein HYC85_006586 [Camellia sinensis]|uniref:Uncharacterized protein n=1 Tax=Camellia sinensis TaxID=4442 RepID=A0A7J7HLH9_CAMSI|nr:hypothetical protein HYC85_006586 [Camellia sinensis]
MERDFEIGNKRYLDRAMNQLTKNLACEWAKDNIRVNTIAAGLIKTSLADAVTQNPLDLEMAKGIVSRTPIGRPGEANEVSSLVAFLCFPAASYITGQCSLHGVNRSSVSELLSTRRG